MSNLVTILGCNEYTVMRVMQQLMLTEGALTEDPQSQETLIHSSFANKIAAYCLRLRQVPPPNWLPVEHIRQTLGVSMLDITRQIARLPMKNVLQIFKQPGSQYQIDLYIEPQAAAAIQQTFGGTS